MKYFSKKQKISLTLLFLVALMLIVAPSARLALAADCDTAIFFHTPNGDLATYGPVQPGTVDMEAKVEICSSRNVDRWWRVTETKDGKAVNPIPVETSKIDNETFDYQPFSVNLTEEGTYAFYLDYSEAGGKDTDLTGHIAKSVSITVSKTATIKTGPATTTAPPNIGYDKTGRTGLVQCGNQVNNPCTVEDIFNIFIIATNLLVGLVGLFTIFVIVWAGSSMVWAAGNTESITKAKKRLVNAIIGLVLVLLAFVLINIVIYGIIGASSTNILTNPLEYIGGSSNNSANTQVDVPDQNAPGG